MRCLHHPKLSIFYSMYNAVYRFMSMPVLMCLEATTNMVFGKCTRSIHVWALTYVGICVCTSLCVCACICIYIYIYICVCMCLYTYTYIHMYNVHLCIYIYIYMCVYA